MTAQYLQTIEALDSIQDAIKDAIAAVNLSKTGLDEAAQAELQTCLNAVLENGGLPAGYSCISQSGSTSAGLKSTFNNILEQFLGILPAKIIDDIQVCVVLPPLRLKREFPADTYFALRMLSCLC